MKYMCAMCKKVFEYEPYETAVGIRFHSPDCLYKFLKKYPTWRDLKIDT